jgi:hypothetical protein
VRILPFSIGKIKKKPATCDSIPKLKIDWDKVDKEEYKKNVLVELEDFRYLKMKTPYGVEQSITHFINSSKFFSGFCSFYFVDIRTTL